MSLIITVVGSVSAAIFVCCVFICYMKKCAPGAPGINLVVCGKSAKKLVKDLDTI